MHPPDYTERVYTTDEGPEPFREYLIYDNYTINRGKAAGHCLVCGIDTTFEMHDTPVLREELSCSNCKTFNRIRQLVAAVAKAYNIRLKPDSSLVSVLRKLPRHTRILLLEEVTPIAAWFDYAARLTGVVLEKSEFLEPGMKSGESKEGVMHLDIMNTHYPDNHFDLILHADVFEHVPNAPKGEAEQYRIVKPGGHIIYTAPTFAQLTKDDVRTKLNKDGSLKKLKKAIYHGDPSPGVLGEAGSIVFRLFSYQEVRERYVALGADYQCLHIYAPLYGMVGQENYVHMIRKPNRRSRVTNALTSH